MRADLLRAADAHERELRLAASALLVLALLAGAGSAHAYANADIERHRTDTFRQVRQTVHTGVPVTGNATLYAPGTWIRDAPLYPKRATGRPRITVETTFPKLVTETEVTQTIQVRVRATRAGTAFWRRTRRLASTTRTVTGGERVTTNATLSIARLKRVARSVRETYGDRGTVSATLVVETRYADDRTTHRITSTLPIKTGSKSFAIGMGSATAKETYTVVRRRTRRNPLEEAMPFLAGGGACVVALLLVLGGVLVADDSRSEVDYLLYEYAEWVSEAEYADVNVTDPDVRHESVRGLIDAAIDAESRVIYSHADRAFYARIGPELHSFVI